MKKYKRYYDKDDDITTPESKPQPEHQSKSKNHTKQDTTGTTKEIIKYNVKMQKNIWGRKKEEQHKNHIKKGIKTKPNPKHQKSRPIPKEILEKHSRGEGLDVNGVRTLTQKKRLERKEDNIKLAHELVARREILLTESAGFLEADAGETTTQFTQKAIAKSVDILAASKSFDLKLMDFGPYRAKYTRNGRHLLLAGKLGHVAAFDWVTKRLHCELNVMETVHDISWLHLETMFAVAQKSWVHIYDNQGIELHCIKKLNEVSQMEFLPYHFLLATVSDNSYISWLDVSIGKMVSQFNARMGKLSLLTQNPYNAVLCLGHSKGIVSMWTPNLREPVAKMLCHSAPLSALHVDPKGLYMATGCVNREIKIWDVRSLSGPMQSYKVASTVNHINLSQKNLMAVGMGNVVDVYRDCCSVTAQKPYLRHRFNNTIGNMQFCPFEDVLGVATSKGFTSLLVPGSGEPNFDAFEANPFQTKSQRREYEVKALLEKIQPELITIDPTVIAEVDVPTLKDKVEMKQKLLHLKPPKIKYEHRNKMKGRGGTANITRNKKIVQELAKKEFVKNIKELKNMEPKRNKSKKDIKKRGDVFDRFLPKT